MGDNGGIESKDENKKEEVVKTPEQLAQERLERYQIRINLFRYLGESNAS